MSYRTGQGSGFVAKPSAGNASPLNLPPKVQALYEAGGAIPVGRMVTQGLAGDGTEVIAALQATASHLNTLVGLFEGQGGTGTAPTVSGLTGGAAVDGDQIWITCSGPGKALITPVTSSNTIPLIALELAATTNDLKETTAPAGPNQAAVYLLETYTGTTQAAKNVFIRLM